MEAEALHPFSSTNADELSFNVGDILKINSNEESGWYKAEMHGREGFIPGNYIRFNPPIWFWPITRDDANKILGEKKNGYNIQKEGSFLVRPSGNTPGEYSLSVRTGDQTDIEHFKIMRSPTRDGYYFWQDDPASISPSINKLIEYYRRSTVSRTRTVRLQDPYFPTVVAQYDYQPSNPEELSMYYGEPIYVIDKDDQNWWRGHLERQGDNGPEVHRGLFPFNYVK